MMSQLSAVRENFGRIRYYSKLFGFRDALSLVIPDRHVEISSVYSTDLKRHIVFRPGTSDLDVLLKITGNYRAAVRYNQCPKFIVDAGANIGVSSLFFAHQFPEAKIYAIEPETSNFELLTQNCKGVENIVPKKMALWNRSTHVNFKDSQAEKWAFSVKESVEDFAIPTITVPQILSESGVEMIDILKIDIEGAEKEVFSEGCAEWLPRVRLLVVELHDRFVPGCSKTFYSSLCAFSFSQEIRGEDVFISLS